MTTVIVIPTYNERKNLHPLLQEIFKVISDVAVLIVDDNSPDGTGILADELSLQDNRVKVLHREKKEGLGKAYIAGFKEVLKMNHDYILQMDADGSHDPRYIPLLLNELSRCDLVVGTRFLGKRFPPHVFLSSVFASRYIKLTLGLKCTDGLGGFKCFKRKVLEEIGLDEFISKGFIFQAEFIYRAFNKGFVLHEIPITFLSRKSGSSKKSSKVIWEAILISLSFIRQSPCKHY
jgi:dolichol-phosphate mannosyltransferase